MREAAFKYTLPVQKALDDNGRLLLVGLASGPEVDGDGERVAPEAIWDVARQINEAPGEIPFRDAHVDDGALMDLGHMTKAWVTDSGHLGVEVELDAENPAAVYLHKQIKDRKKQYGMSVRGTVTDWVDEFSVELGKAVRTFKNLFLREISATTKPSWSHSLGTVIAKAIKDAEDAESDAAVGDNVEDELQTEQETTETPAADENTEEQPAAEEEAVTEEATEETAEEEAPAADAEVESTEEATEEEPAAEEAAEEVVTEAEAEETEEPSEPDDLSAGFREALVGFHNNLTQMLTYAGLVQPVMVTKSVSQDENEPTLDVAKAISDATAPLVGQIEDLKKSLDEATARIEELENSPAGDDAPVLVEKHALTVDEISKAMADMDPRERLRLGLRFGLKSDR